MEHEKYYLLKKDDEKYYLYEENKEVKEFLKEQTRYKFRLSGDLICLFTSHLNFGFLKQLDKFALITKIFKGSFNGEECFLIKYIMKESETIL